VDRENSLSSSTFSWNTDTATGRSKIEAALDGEHWGRADARNKRRLYELAVDQRRTPPSCPELNRPKHTKPGGRDECQRQPKTGAVRELRTNPEDRHPVGFHNPVAWSELGLCGSFVLVDQPAEDAAPRDPFVGKVNGGVVGLWGL